nr:1-deoxy-D-xylulose-5-phosphate synthase N-terminal domain-containing protein [Tessaracoccus coleopterorum]
MRTDHRYEKTLSFIKRGVTRLPVVGRPFYDLLHGFKTGVKDVLAPQSMFSDLGIKYTGPIDGHDIAALTNHLEQAREFGGPVIVHCVTRKGRASRRPRRTRRTASTPSAGSTSSPGNRYRRRSRPPGRTRWPRPWCSWGSGAPTWWPSPRRC